MDTSTPRNSLIINNSPIEFAVVGPKNERSGILVRSENLRIDLIGLAAVGSENSNSSSNFISDLFFASTSRIMWSVTSTPHNQIGRDWDKRKSEYRFYWVGLCSKSDRELVRSTFNRQITDLLFAIKQNDTEQVEWSIAPVIFLCSENHIRSVKRKQYSLPVLIVYTFVFFMSLGIFLQIFLTKFLLVK